MGERRRSNVTGSALRTQALSAIEWVFLNPVKPAIDEQKLVAIDEMQFHVHLAVVHLAVKNQLIGGRTLEAEFAFPVLVGEFRQCDRFVAGVDDVAEGTMLV